MSNHATNDATNDDRDDGHGQGSDGPSSGSGTHATRANAHADILLGMADRLQTLEKDAAVLRADIVSLVGSIRESAAAPAVPVKAYTLGQVGEAIGLKETAVRKLLGPGGLPSFRTDGSRRVLVADLDRYLEQLRDRTQQQES